MGCIDQLTFLFIQVAIIVPAVVWSMNLKFRSEKGEIFEDTPFGSGRVSYLVFLQELFRFIPLCIEEITRVVRDSDNGDIKGELCLVELLLILLKFFYYGFVTQLFVDLI